LQPEVQVGYVVRAFLLAPGGGFQYNASGEYKGKDIKQWINDPCFDPSLWKVAWEADEIASGALNYVDQDEQYERKEKL
jgi:hypothetical protein